MAYTLRFRVGTHCVGKCSVTAHLLLNGEPPKERSLRLELQNRSLEVNVADFVDAKFVYVTTPSDVGKRVGIQFDFATIEPVVQVFLGDVQLIVAPQADTPGNSGIDAREHLRLSRPQTASLGQRPPNQNRRKLIWEDTASPLFGPAALRAGEIRAGIPGSCRESGD